MEYKRAVEMRRCLALVFGMLIMVTCGNDKNADLTGTLIYSQRVARIVALALTQPNESPRVLYEGDGVSITALSHGRGRTILFDECGFIGAKTATGYGCRIREYDLDTGAIRTLRFGNKPTVLGDLLFFYDEVEGETGQSLFSAPFDGAGQPTRITRSSKPQILPNGIKIWTRTPVLPVSSTEIVFVGHDAKLWIYDVSLASRKPLGVEGCRPEAFRSKGNEIVCRSWGGKDNFLVNLTTGKVTKFGELFQNRAFEYVEEFDMMFFSKGRYKFPISEAYDIFVYDFSTQRDMRIRKDTYMSDAVWFP